MAAGDFIVRSNSSNTDEIPDSGSTLDLLWPGAVDSNGSSITYNALTGEFTLVDIGRYLILYNDQSRATSTTDNQRLNTRIKSIIGGVTTDYCRSSAYNRKRNGVQEAIHYGCGIINTTSASTLFKLQYDREDNVTGSFESPDRLPDRSGITIIKLDDSWNYARYRTTANISCGDTDNSSVDIDWDAIDEEDGPFTLTGGVGNTNIDIATTNLCIAIATLPILGPGSFNKRSDFHMRFSIGASVHRVGWTYVRNHSSGCVDGCLTGAYAFQPSSGDDLKVTCYSNEIGTTSGGANLLLAGGNLQIVELPSSAKWILLEATTGNINGVNTDFDWDTNPHIDTDVFTHTPGNSEVTVDSDGDYLAFTGLFATTNNSALRLNPSIRFNVNNATRNQAGISSYVRGQGTNAGYGGLRTGTLLTGLTASDVIEVNCDRIGTQANNHNNGQGFLSIIELDSLFSGAPVAEIALNDTPYSLLSQVNDVPKILIGSINDVIP